MQAAANALQAATHALLIADTGAGGLLQTGSPMVTGVFDVAGVPEGQAYPYVTIGEFFSQPFTTWGREGEEIVSVVKIWTQARGGKTANTILKRLNYLLGNAALSVSGYSLARSIFDRYSPQSNDVGDGAQGVRVEYRIWLQET